MDRMPAQRSKRYSTGTVIFEEHEPGNRMYVVRRGKVRIFRKVHDHEIVLATLGPGEFFGEMALLEKLPRSASAQTVEDSLLIEVDQKTFELMIRKNSEIAVRIMRKLAARVRELDRRLQNVLVDSGLGRAVEVLRWLLPRGMPEGSFFRIKGVTAHVHIAASAGIPPAEVELVLHKLRRAGCLREEGSDVLVAGLTVLDDYSMYLELKRKYEPQQTPSVPSEAQRIKQQDAKKQMLRLIKALQSQPGENDDQTAMTVQYKQFLDLKARFEPEE
ncbi:MAG: Crp/Fnr family transcriptional regulator [Deltaproteobacteria bacterium]|nr:Crp/Fnr family transcriptional regulator [Deltaproteobacteria bacterium]